MTDPHTNTDWPAARVRRTPQRLWRSLPLTAQLAVTGMIVMLAWFLTARTATDRQEERQRARTETLRQLHSAELVATRLGISMASMSAAQRGFLLTGHEELLVPFDAGARALATDMAALRERSAFGGPLRQDLDRLSALLDAWADSIVHPNLALRRSAGAAAFDEGSVGEQRLLLGARMMTQARALHALVLRDLRDDVITTTAEAEEWAAVDQLESFGIRAAAVLIFLLLGTLILRFVARSLNQVVGAADALEQGRYADAHFPDADRSPNREMARLADTFGSLATSIQVRETQLQEDIEKLKELERLKNDFVSTVSHELRTPLTSMRGALGLILGGKVGDVTGRARDLLQIAMTNTERLIRLINDILDIEKMDAGQVAVRRDRLPVRPLVETTLAGLESFARDAKVRLELHATGAPVVIGDSDRLIQVLTNLISNAVKFSPTEGRVEVAVTPTRGAVSIRVRDHGPGIPVEFAGRIFGRFQQAGGAESRRSGGTGLGLHIAKAIVEMHGGSIGFEPAEGGGTTFWIELPTVTEPTGTVSSTLAVLVVEDDVSMAQVLVAHLEGMARAIAVPSAEQALEVLAKEPIAAMILDPGLPGMSGLELVRRVRADAKLRTMPVFLFSSNEFAPEELRSAGIRAGDVFVKSRDAEDVLFGRLSTELARRR